MKLDLHVHYYEATGYVPLCTELVGTLVNTIKEKGLDGIAVINHQWHDQEYPFMVRDIVARDYNNEVLIIPGIEFDVGYNHEVELYLSENRTFRFLAHPGDPYTPKPIVINNIQGIELKNAQHFVDRETPRIAEEHNLITLYNSDAHQLSKIGSYYNEIELDTLFARALPR